MGELWQSPGSRSCSTALVLKSLTLGHVNSVDRNLFDLEFLVSRWSTETQTFLGPLWHRQVWPIIGRRDHSDINVVIRGCTRIGVNLAGENQKRLDLLTKSLSDSKCAANKATYLS